MATIPPRYNSTIEAIYRKFETNHVESSRAHLGASMIGRECNRALWYGFRWATVPNFPGRVLRLFKRGHDEEDILFVIYHQLMSKFGLLIKTKNNLAARFTAATLPALVTGWPKGCQNPLTKPIYWNLKPTIINRLRC